MQPIGRNADSALARELVGSRWTPVLFCLLALSAWWLVAFSGPRAASAARGEAHAAYGEPDTGAPRAGSARPAVEAGSTDAPAERAPQPETPALRDELARLIQQLDAEAYDVRRGAAARLEELCSRPESASALALELRRALLRADLSFEVRRRLEAAAHRLPAVPPAGLGPRPGPEDLDRVVEQFQSPSFAVRQAAAERLDWVLSDPRLAGPLLSRLRSALARATRQPDTWRSLEAAWHDVRGIWLLAGAPAEGLQMPGTSRIRAWVETLADAGPAGDPPGEGLAVRLAEIELLDALAWDQVVPEIEKALDARLERTPDRKAAARLARFRELTRPSMVAEYWEDRQHLGEQHLLVGVPSLAEGATRPSHFDRIDDRTAHCVSGQTLLPGDYPVGVAFPHPAVETAFFHLVNLPTPRRRMAYSYYVQADQAERLRAISRRTLDRFTAEKRLLSEAELVMLALLDPEEVSRFAGPYLLLVDDQPLGPDGRQRTGGRPSAHGLLCGLLAAEGTQSAGPGLVRAIEEHRFLPPTSAAPYRLEYVATLAIAGRDPWAQANQWLARQIRQPEALIDGRLTGPELGATAAAVLLERHERSPAAFGLEAAADPLLLQLGVPGHRFAAERDRGRVQQWWERLSELQRRP